MAGNSYMGLGFLLVAAFLLVLLLVGGEGLSKTAMGLLGLALGIAVFVTVWVTVGNTAITRGASTNTNLGSVAGSVNQGGTTITVPTLVR